ncbi:hypothetical protein SKB45_001696 [Salmonella enterica]|uniref:Uncharacterized protein n=1 Tax=Salmonella enterica TaxID=28901 RepID=A0A743J0P7_SALER|nr:MULTISPECIES: hypothetical protein [Enterobacteriaceae]EDN6221147.1 hypothetical protein [Salmonella enterica]EDQ4123967.1 hypothetical protein [Salmonella enterica subsp. enterica serovar Sandiego]EDQ9728780.1 hypothetical protein [Salmonella enterica subsp. enterica]EDT0272348.1 hypothetical protein [Salmonella enterica subsp. enterica serovar Schwarzengrund]EDT9890868.1 hypothetical protein [Salmonella enterica subsp. enterica serovar Panama]EDU3267582.1 hypothetical protein [Salmonella
MTKKDMTDMLIRAHGVSWETAYQYLWESEWVFWMASACIREDQASGLI